MDFHLPPVGIGKFPKEARRPVRDCADIVKTKRDPTRKPEVTFKYVDISSVDVETGTIVRAQDLTGEEAPSRARKVIHAYDIIISTCRPTRGAIAVVPEDLHGQICSTGFSVIRAKEEVNPFYLHFALRLESTLEQFRKWSTGSSYPAILDEDVAKTLIPLPDSDVQDRIARIVRSALAERDRVIQAANLAWRNTADGIVAGLSSQGLLPDLGLEIPIVFSIDQVTARIRALAPVEEEAVSAEDEMLELFEEEERDQD